MSKKYLKIALVVLVVVVIGNLFVIQDALAAHEIIEKLKLTRSATSLPEYDDPVSVVVLLIKGALGLVAIIFFIMIIISGFKWMTAGGNEEIVAKAKKNISNAIIGLVVIMFAYVITSFVLNIILDTGAVEVSE